MLSTIIFLVMLLGTVLLFIGGFLLVVFLAVFGDGSIAGLVMRTTRWNSFHGRRRGQRSARRRTTVRPF
jgi:hypothetical protein